MKKKLIILAIFILTFFSFNSVFANAGSDFEYFVKNNIPNFQNNENYSNVVSALSSYDNLVVAKYRYYTFPGSEGDNGTNRTYYVDYFIIASDDVAHFEPGNSNGIVFWAPLRKVTIKFTEDTGLYTCEISNEQTSSYNIIQLGYDNSKELLFTTTDIFDLSGNLVYSATDTTIPDTGETEGGDLSGDFQATLPRIVQETQSEEVLAEIVGLLPIVMVCLVCWIGLRKALQLLSELLKQS